ncbi:MAG: flippase-like domain-containing protein [Kiritimatiellae bacterium]|nr:flippase-like domain-containing protein [Kiritimatiellia bacterium]
MARTTRIQSVVFLGFSLLVAAAVFAHIFSHITWRQVADLMTGVDLPRAGLFVGLSLAMHLARTWRYRVILHSVGQSPGFFRLFPAVLVRGLCVDLLPARSGELVYIYLLRARLGVDLGAASASFALAILFDLMALAPLVMIALPLAGGGVTLSPGLLAAAGCALLALSAALIGGLPAALRWAFGVCSRAPLRPPRARRALRRLLAGTHRQIGRARARGVYVPVFGLSILVRLLKYGALYALLLAMLHPQGYAPASLPFPKVFLGLCAAELSASLPISGIAGFGAYEGAWVLVFGLLGFPMDLARATSVSHHLFSQLYGYALGLLGLIALLALPGRRARANHRM